VELTVPPPPAAPAERPALRSLDGGAEAAGHPDGPDGGPLRPGPGGPRRGHLRLVKNG
jgi:hypothetical protein